MVGNKNQTQIVVRKVQYSASPKAKNANVKSKKSRPSKKTKANVTTQVISAPVSRQVSSTTRSPKMLSGNAMIRIAHSELIGPVISSSVGFALARTADGEPGVTSQLRLRCNPGSQKTFNWLSTIAPLYENYRFKKLNFRFQTRVAATVSGDFTLSPDYDAADGNYATSEQLIMNNRGTYQGSVWQNHIVKMDPAAMNRLYKSHTCMSDERFATSAQDQKTIDAAQAYIFLDVDQSGTMYGKLWVDYEVELHDPQSPTDPVNQGGYSIKVDTPTVNSNQPVSTVSLYPKVNILQERKPVMADPFTPGIESSLTFPSAFLGRFNRDYSGTLELTRAGTGLSGDPLVYISKALNGAAGGADTVVPWITSVLNGAGTNQANIANITALAGDYLKFNSGPATTLSQAVLRLGGFNAISII